MDYTINTRADARNAENEKREKNIVQDKRIKKKCMEEKEEWLNKEYKENEKAKYTSVEGMHKIKAFTRMKRCILSGCTEDKDGKIFVEKMAIIKRWSEYTEKPFQGDGGNKPETQKYIDGPKILQSEVKAGINKM